ncbi:MAG: lmo0937 family membrane protein [Smithellaceae bacterium]|jgi:ABC-type Fe3+-siderophore transport system permease subunit
MLWTIAAVLVILWLLGSVSGYTMGNFIHFLLLIVLIAISIVLVRVRSADPFRKDDPYVGKNF